MGTSLASAQDLNPADYFQLSYDPVTFDKNEIQGSEVFYAIIAGCATCTKDLPVSASQASLTSRVVAVHTASGTEVTLNSDYNVAIKPFPSKKDETFEINQAVPLQFPSQAESGDYNVIGKIVEAKVKVIIWVPVTDYLPQEQPMGLVKYTASKSSATLPPPSAPPSTSIPAPPSTPNPSPSPEPPEPIILWWFELIVLVAITTTVFNIVWFLRHRKR